MAIAGRPRQGGPIDGRRNGSLVEEQEVVAEGVSSDDLQAKEW